MQPLLVCAPGRSSAPASSRFPAQNHPTSRAKHRPPGQPKAAATVRAAVDTLYKSAAASGVSGASRANEEAAPAAPPNSSRPARHSTPASSPAASRNSSVSAKFVSSRTSR